MPDREMNRVQRRLWQAFVESGADAGAQSELQRLRRVIDDQLRVMPPALRYIMEMVLASADEPDYPRLVDHIQRDERVRISIGAVRQRVSRGIRMLEHAVRATRWSSGPPTLPLRRAGEKRTPGPLEVTAIVFQDLAQRER